MSVRGIRSVSASQPTMEVPVSDFDVVSASAKPMSLIPFCFLTISVATGPRITELASRGTLTVALRPSRTFSPGLLSTVTA